MAVSIIVLSYRPGEWLEPCLASVVGQADQIVLVDNGSAGEKASAIGRKLGTTVVRSPTNLGFAGGVNLGAEHARGDVIALLNDDAVAEPGWLDSAASVLKDPSVAAVTPKVLLAGSFAELHLSDEPWFAPGDARPLGRQMCSVRAEGTEVLDRLVGPGVHQLERGESGGKPASWRWTAGRLPFYVPVPELSETPEIVINDEPVAATQVCRLINHAGSYLRDDGYAGEYGVEAPDDGRFDHPAERFGFSGTAPVFRAETFRRIGGFAPQFFAYNEDTDWCLRARLAGLRIMYDPNGTVHHRHSATSGGPQQARVRFLLERNRLLCLVRNAPDDLARHYVWRRIVEGPDQGIRRSLLQKLPWAAASRIQLRRLWVTSPRQVWDQWAGADTAWDEASKTG